MACYISSLANNMRTKAKPKRCIKAPELAEPFVQAAMLYRIDLALTEGTDNRYTGTFGNPNDRITLKFLAHRGEVKMSYRVTASTEKEDDRFGPAPFEAKMHSCYSDDGRELLIETGAYTGNASDGLGLFQELIDNIQNNRS